MIYEVPEMLTSWESVAASVLAGGSKGIPRGHCLIQLTNSHQVPSVCQAESGVRDTEVSLTEMPLVLRGLTAHTGRQQKKKKKDRGGINSDEREQELPNRKQKQQIEYGRVAFDRESVVSAQR